jgi:acyl carrier protein
MKPSLDEIRTSIVDILREMLAEWGVGEEPVHGATLLADDLGLSSVDALQLMATLDMRLGKKLPYERLIIQDGEYRKDLTVDQFAEFAHRYYDEPPSGVSAM